ncbi:hypothetical protein EB14_02361 [Enterococcus faecium]|uniref:hypothetical protein n=3 Tax=Enterococcus TaxID=1350 RepID=UPI0002A2B701|nr:hypothetical protein [Enterococcus faecium]ELA57460.1 hypothetical protein OGE_04737 [Enterococcus faecium EnGen0022]RBS30652.1 hypothetical protein EB14_02361 [Enterococcus faecium]
MRDLHECSLIPEELDEKLLEEFYNNLPHEEDFEVTSAISSIAELWLEKNLQVSKTQIFNWKKGKDFPTEENFEKLKKLVGLKGKGAFLLYEFSELELLHMFLKSPTVNAVKRGKEIMYFNTLKYFANVLFFYCSNNEQIKLLLQKMEDNLINDSYTTTASSFFMEIWNLKVSRELDPADNNPRLADYFKMEDKEVEYILNKAEPILNDIFNEENICLLKSHADKKFDDEKKEALFELIASIENKKSIDDFRLVSEPKFRKLYHPKKETANF